MIFGKPEYKLVPIDLKSEDPVIKTGVRLSGTGPYDNVVIGLGDPVVNAAGQLNIEWSILSIPQNLASSAADVTKGVGRAYKDIATIVNKCCSIILADCMKETDGK